MVKLDRLTRSLADLGMLVERYFGQGKAALLSVGEQIDTRSAAERLVLNVLASVSQWEREAIAERTATAMQHKARQGEYTGGQAPFRAPRGRGRSEDGASPAGGGSARRSPQPSLTGACRCGRSRRRWSGVGSGVGRGGGSRRCRWRGWWRRPPCRRHCACRRRTRSCRPRSGAHSWLGGRTPCTRRRDGSGSCAAIGTRSAWLLFVLSSS